MLKSSSNFGPHLFSQSRDLTSTTCIYWLRLAISVAQSEENFSACPSSRQEWSFWRVISKGLSSTERWGPREAGSWPRASGSEHTDLFWSDWRHEKKLNNQKIGTMVFALYYVEKSFYCVRLLWAQAFFCFLLFVCFYSALKCAVFFVVGWICNIFQPYRALPDRSMKICTWGFLSTLN